MLKIAVCTDVKGPDFDYALANLPLLCPAVEWTSDPEDCAVEIQHGNPPKGGAVRIWTARGIGPLVPVTLVHPLPIAAARTNQLFVPGGALFSGKLKADIVEPWAVLSSGQAAVGLTADGFFASRLDFLRALALLLREEHTAKGEDCGRPWADELAWLLLSMACRRLDREIPERPRPRMIVTHDVDVLDTTPFNAMRRFCGDMLGATRALGRHGTARAIRGAGRAAIRALESEYDQIANILDLERTLGVRSIFFFSAPWAARDRWRSALFDPTYDSGRIARLKSAIDRAREDGWEIGLHYGAATPGKGSDAVRRQKEALEGAFEAKIDAGRQHWFVGEFASYRAAAEAGLRHDFSAFRNHQIGFSAATAQPYYPVPGHSMREIPTVVMDGTLFQHNGHLDPDEAFETAWKPLETAFSSGGTVAIDWHQHAFAPSYDWKEVFVRIVNRALDRGVEVVTPSKL